MTHCCSLDSCFRDTTCALGHIDRNACEHWREEEPQGDETQKASLVEKTGDISWNGYVLGTSDLSIIGGRGRPAVIGLIGPPDSGKTSLLAYLYMWLLEHGCVGRWVFAGSWTLGAWESLVQYSRWSGEPPPSFPPHTSSAGRHPGILHLALRCTETGRLRDVMFTDAPGEWFTHWSRVPRDATSEGARWVVNHSDALVLLVDSDALADLQKRPASRRATRDLMERVAADASSPVVVVWTKGDVDVPEPAAQPLQSASKDFLPQAKVMCTTTQKPESIEVCFAWALATATSPRAFACSMEPRLSDHPFFALRGLDAYS